MAEVVTKESICGAHCVYLCESTGLDRPDILLTLISELAVSELVNIFGLDNITALICLP